MAETLLAMATDLVLAQIRVQGLAPEEMHTALTETYHCLRTLQAREASRGHEAVKQPETPLVNWRKSITKHFVVCLVCGARFKQLSGRHLRKHGLTAHAYRLSYGIPLRQSLSARSVAIRRSQVAKQARPWEKAPMYLKGREQGKATQAAVQKTRQAPKKKASRVNT